jgi:hypothetical protein
MKLLDVSKDYFSGFQDISNYKENDAKSNLLAAVKILSYFTVIIPLGFSALYGISSLYGRVNNNQNVTKPSPYIAVDFNQQAQKILGTNTTPTSPVSTPSDKSKIEALAIEDPVSSSLNSKVDSSETIAPILTQDSPDEISEVEELTLPVNSAEDSSEIKDSTLAIADSQADFSNLPEVDLSEVLNAYDYDYQPLANQENLLHYRLSEDYKRHAKTARIYYNTNQLTKTDALRIIFQREPTNIEMGNDQYNKEHLEELFGYRQGIYNDISAKKTDGSLFKELPNSAMVYSETYLWDPPGGENKKEVACLSLPAPALDSVKQPHYDYYMKTGRLDAKKYENEIAFLFRSIEKVVRDHKDTAFDGKGIKRLVLSKFGQGAFLTALSGIDRQIAQNAYKQQMAIFLDRVKDVDLEIVMSEYFLPSNGWHDHMIIGDIIETGQERDLIINAWDPHSAPGNGNDADRSFDGAMGKGSGILLTQTSWLNKTLRSPDSAIPVT